MIVQYLGQRDDTFEGCGGFLVLRCQSLTVATPVRQDSHTSCLRNQITYQPVENNSYYTTKEQETSTLYLPCAHQIPSLKVYFFFFF